jgi:hypothetical protein
MDKYNDRMFLVSVPESIDKWDGSLIMTQVVVSGKTIKTLGQIIRRNSTEAKRHVAEVPYAPDGFDGQKSTKQIEFVVEYLRREAMAVAMNDGRSIVGVGPVRWHDNGRMGMGIARMEYTTVPLTVWED